MSTINQLLESANPWQSLQGDATRLANKWAKSGLLEGLSGFDKSNMSMLLENQAKELLAKYGIGIPAGHAALTVEEAVEGAKKLPGPLYVVKAQIHAGGKRFFTTACEHHCAYFCIATQSF